MAYEPRGRMIDFMAALRREPARLFTIAQAAEILHCKAYPSSVDAYLHAAIREAAAFRINLRGEWLYASKEIGDEMLVASGRAPRDHSGVRVAASPFTAQDRERASADPRAPGSTGFVPKPMVAPRPGSEQPRPASATATEDELAARISAANESLNERLRARRENEMGKRTTSAATASGHEIPDSPSTARPAEAAGTQQEQHRDAHTEEAGATAERCEEVANEGDARAASGGCAHDEEDQPDAYLSCRTGELVIVGIEPDEAGRITVPPDLVGMIKRCIAWAPAA